MSKSDSQAIFWKMLGIDSTIVSKATTAIERTFSRIFSYWYEVVNL